MTDPNSTNNDTYPPESTPQSTLPIADIQYRRRVGARSPIDEYEQLPLLPGTNTIDLAAIRMKKAALKARPKQAANTVTTYESHFRGFTAWCYASGKSSLPASAETVSLYATWMLTEQKYRLASVTSHLNAIIDAHKRAGLEPPSTEEAREIRAAVKRQRKEFSLSKTALSVKHLIKACELFLKGRDTNKARRDHAMVVLGFATGLRRSEIADLKLADVRFVRQGLTVFCAKAKNDQEEVGRTLAVWAGARDSTDPVRVLKRWIEVRGEWAGPLFTRITKRDVVLRLATDGGTVGAAVKLAAARAGLDPQGYGGHSLRAGALTASADKGRSDRELMRFSGHKKPESLRPYVRESEAFSGRNPLPDVL